MWWIANMEEDKTKEVMLIFKNLNSLQMDFTRSKLATSTKLRQEWEQRLEKNSIAVDCLQLHRDVWILADGRDPDLLAVPSTIDLEEAALTRKKLETMLEKNGPKGYVAN